MQKYEMKLKRDRTFKKGGFSEKVKRVIRKDKKEMTPEETISIYETLLKAAEKQGRAIDVVFRAMGGNGYKTFTDPARIRTEQDEYWTGKVKETSKFTNFKYVDIYIKSPL